MKADPTYKDIFAHAFMVEELMRWLVADLLGGHELVDALDFSTLLRMHEQSVTGNPGNLRRYHSDIVWRVRWRDRPDGDDAWLYLILMLEFQAEVDFLMALRIRNQVDNFHMERWRGKRFQSTDRLPPVLPIVLYNGVSPWSAVARVADLVTPGVPISSRREAGVAGKRRIRLLDEWPGTKRGETGIPSGVGPLFAGDGYLVLDTLRVAAEHLRDDNAAALLAGLENPSPDRFAGQLTALLERLGARELAPLREVMLHWAQQVMQLRFNLDLGVRQMAEVDRLQESGELAAFWAARRQEWQDKYRAEGRAQGIEKGIEQGIERGIERGIEQGIERGIEKGIEHGLTEERDLLCRQAARKFGTGVADQLAHLLAEIDDARRLATAGEWIIDCATGEDLIARFGQSFPRGI